MKTFLILCEYSLDSIIVINAKTHNEAVIKYFKEVDEDIISLTDREKAYRLSLSKRRD